MAFNMHSSKMEKKILKHVRLRGYCSIQEIAVKIQGIIQLSQKLMALANQRLGHFISSGGQKQNGKTNLCDSINSRCSLFISTADTPVYRT